MAQRAPQAPAHGPVCVVVRAGRGLVSPRPRTAHNTPQCELVLVGNTHVFVRWTQTELDRLLRERREAQLAKQAASEDAQAQPGEEEEKVPKLDQLLAKKKAE